MAAALREMYALEDLMVWWRVRQLTDQDRRERLGLWCGGQCQGKTHPHSWVGLHEHAVPERHLINSSWKKYIDRTLVKSQMRKWWEKW